MYRHVSFARFKYDTICVSELSPSTTDWEVRNGARKRKCERRRIEVSQGVSASPGLVDAVCSLLKNPARLGAGAQRNKTEKTIAWRNAHILGALDESFQRTTS